MPLAQRDTVLQQSRIILATPDVCHAWLLRRVNEPAVRDFLRRLRVIIIDEAHAYESVFGSNSSYLFRRLTAAALHAGAPEPPRFIAATATIQTPGQHLGKLTGADFTVIEESQNGSPRHPRRLHHLPTDPRGGAAEDQLAQLVTSIIDNDPAAQLIAFHDSRMGIERIVPKIGRPEEVLPYRSGYLAQDRRNIEARIRDNSIRGVIATSALELGIDMPDLNYGVNLDLPPSRKAFHQRLGRVGRSKPGSFIILAPATRFSTYGETLRDYYQNSVEPSHLYLDNDHINYQQARCLKDEMERCGLDSRKAPEPPSWPEGFQEVLRNAHGRPPVHLLNTVEERTDAPPQIAHGLRNAGEETLRILTRQEEGSWEAIGFINIQAAMNEAYPGGIYRHRGTSYQVESWGREKNTRQPFIRTRQLKGTGRTTKPILRRTAVIPRDPTGIINRREMDHGHLSELRVVVTESVEGCENA